MSQLETFSDVFVRNPLLRRQVGAMRRARWQRAALFGTWALFGIALGLGMVIDHSQGLLAVVAIVTALRSLVSGVGAVSREQEQQTWEMLVLTRLTPLELLAGRMVPALLTVVLPAAAAVPCVAVLGWAAGVSAGPMLLALLCVIALAPPWTALAVRLSATAARTTDAFVRTALVMALTSPLVLQVLALVQDARYGWSLGAVAHLAATTLCLSAAVTAALLLSTAGVMPGAARDYPRQARFAAGAVYVLTLVLIYLVAAQRSGVYRYSPANFATMAGINALLASLGAALACAAAGVPRKLLALRSFHPFAEGPEGALGLWGLLYLAGSTLSTIPWLLADLGSFWTRYGLLRPSTWVAILGPVCLLAGGTFGCMLARSRSRWPAAARMALAGAVLLALFVLPQCLADTHAYHRSWSPYGGSATSSMMGARFRMAFGMGPAYAVLALLVYTTYVPGQMMDVFLNLGSALGEPLLPGLTLVVAMLVTTGAILCLGKLYASFSPNPGTSGRCSLPSTKV